MADGEALAMAEELKRGREEVVEGSSKRVKPSELFDEPLVPVVVSSEQKQQPNGVSQVEEQAIGKEDAGTAEVVDGSGGGSGSASVEDEEGVYSDVDEEFVEESDSDDEEEGEYSDSEGDSDLELQYENAASIQAAQDRKGKGIVLDKGKGKAVVEDYKGKGKAIVQEEDSSDDSEVGVENEDIFRGHPDLLEDPLEEVDLNNILPTRTRRRRFQQPVHCDPGDGSSEEDEDYVAGGTPGDQ